MPCRLAITSMSLGRCYAGHSLSHKLDMAHAYGYKGIELFHEDLADLASQLRRQSSISVEESELEAASLIRQMCRARDLAILCLQPFAGYEGLLDRAEQARRLDQLRFWFRLAKELGTDMVQIPSSFLPASQCTGDRARIVADLRRVADMGRAEGIRFVYEALCFGTHTDTWEASWAIVQAVDRPNFGLCLDTFNIAGRVYADPASPTGCCGADAPAAVQASLARLRAAVDVAKVFYVQVVDAERLASPLRPGHAFYDAQQPARMSWSRNCRLFYGERDRGAYLPVRDVARAIFHGLGFEGWVSLELFHRRMADRDAGVPRELARRGAVSWRKLVGDMQLRIEDEVYDERVGDLVGGGETMKKGSIASHGDRERVVASL
ncbi:xylose isomerase-like TIM barrel [Apiospora rasikravindrae]|uniref:Xylose isomerase-like TIM barrel n=1 Tax=Apiospora rasikravindrae TaxID=990691 RepID=A0ABR1RPM3_9PEZI